MFVRVESVAFGLIWFAFTILCTVVANPVHAASQFHLLHYFAAGSDGANPFAGLVADPWGTLYGVTEYGGVPNGGVVFAFTTGNNEDSILYTFTGQSGGTDGALPIGGVAIGNCNTNTEICMIYGTTSQGGASSNCSGGCGTIFEVATDGSEYTQLHSFGGSDGSNPIAGLVADSSGDLYGTTFAGGGTGCGGGGCGTVFELASDGTFSTLYTFCMKTNCKDGQYPGAPVLISNGTLYGTTEFGGANSKGTVFEFQSQQEMVLYSFCPVAPCSDGAQPEGGLVMDSKSNLYGTTYTGGNETNCSGGGCGTVFELSPGTEWTELPIQQFGRNQNPEAGLISDSKGNLYGAIPGGSSGGAGKNCSKGCQFGETYEINSANQFDVQYVFTGKGAEPVNPPIIVNGKFYGTTEFGGYPCQNHTTCGTIYEIVPGEKGRKSP